MAFFWPLGMMIIKFFIPHLTMRPSIAPALLLFALSPLAQAHDLWFEQDGAAYILLQGHRHSAHAGAETIAYDPAHVREALCLGDDGKLRPLAIGKTAPVKLAASCHAVWANFVSGYWTKTAWETRNQPKTGISGVLKSWYSEESVKRIDRWQPSLTRPLGNGLEISPQSDPLALKPGDKLTVLVSEGGKPLAGIPVAYAGDTRGATGEDGRIAIRLRQGGVQLIAASLETPLADGKADTSMRSAALQFEIAK